MDQVSLELVAGILGALASFGAFVKWVWPWIKGCYRKMFGAAQVVERLDELSEQVGWLVSEMKTNAGTSIKDQLNRVETACAKTNERQRARMLDSSDLVFETDPDGSCVWVNRTYARTVQRLPQELMGHGWVNAIARDHRDRVMKGWYDAVDEDREFEMKFNFSTPDGDEFPALVRSYKMTDSRGNAIGYLGSVTLL